jgi:anthranilate 1,2-dioxygenase small subunit
MDSFTRIARSQAAYARCIDNNQLESWPDFFAEDCEYKITTTENLKLGYEAGLVHAYSRGMLIDRITALREANIYEGQIYRHILGQPAILAEDATTAECETPFIVARVMRDGTTDLYATGRYMDRYRLDGEEPKLTRRIVVCDSGRIDTLMALPL